MHSISVIVPVYNAAPFIAETLESILRQSLPASQIIVVDDCSTDSTLQIVRQIAERNPTITILQAPSNFGGPAGPRNMGIRQASGDLIAFCDADDVWHVDKLALQMAAYIKHHATIVACRVKNFRDGTASAILEHSTMQQASASPVSYWTMLCKDVIAMSSIMCEKDALITAGLFNESKSYSSVEDYDLWLRLMSNPRFKAIKVNAPLVAYRLLSTSLSSNRLRHMRRIRKVVFTHCIQAHGWLRGLLLQPVVLIGYVYLAIYWRWIKRGL